MTDHTSESIDFDAAMNRQTLEWFRTLSDEEQLRLITLAGWAEYFLRHSEYVETEVNPTEVAKTSILIRGVLQGKGT
jgi:hypothetical protein